ncbi:MAG: nucleotidyltransferase family protein [Eubacteriales bacterium]
MIVSGIVAEYNPFHKGHAYQLEQTRQAGATHTIAVMSGNFVQRGEPAIALKQARTKMALANGVDIVIDLPIPWATANAGTFALGAISLLNALGCVDMLSFGSESGDLNLLKSAAKAVASKQVNNETIKKHLTDGSCFASAREAAVREHFGDEVANILKSPNDTLAVEYIRAINLLDSKMIPFAVKRLGAGHDEIAADGLFASASQIRKSLLEYKAFQQYLPKATVEILAKEIEVGRAPADYKRLETAVLCALRSLSAKQIANAPDISEGIENRIFDAARFATSLEQLFSLAKTKRYSHARIRRIVLHSFLGIKAIDSGGCPPYIRILGVNLKGRELLRIARKTATLPVVMKAADIFALDERAKRVFTLECRAADIFALSLPEPLPCGFEQTSNIALGL